LGNWLATLSPEERRKFALAGVQARKQKKSQEQIVRFSDVVNVDSLDLNSEQGVRSLEDSCVRFLATPNASRADLPFVRQMLNAIDSIGARREHHDENERIKKELLQLQNKLRELENEKRQEGGFIG
jgi:hypothetical protein